MIGPAAVCPHGQRDQKGLDRLKAVGRLGLYQKIKPRRQPRVGQLAVRIRGLGLSHGGSCAVLLQLGRKGAVFQVCQGNPAVFKAVDIAICHIAILKDGIGNLIERQFTA